MVAGLFDDGLADGELQTPLSLTLSELSSLSLDTRTPNGVDYSGEDGGKTGYYLLRGVATTSEKGLRGETAGATIGA